MGILIETDPFCNNCGEDDCNVGADGTCSMIRAYKRYNYLRSRDLETITNGGVFAGKTPENIILNNNDLDIAIDNAMHT
jgi:hypothetical protein